ncbi:glutamic acid-rich protein-like [Helianthus annuus]|uniref:glutamic acid-rich protein-like n=1 Tax=Helianthus annuus TaxID=4232 RepID=UPI000B8FA796|nr:glutamic acid-rich protein-like [Helianthus annuus]
MLVDESDKEDEAVTEGDAEGDQVRLSPESARLLKALTKNLETEKAAGDEEGDDVDKSSSSSSEEDIDETERAERIRAKIEKEKQLKRKRREDKDDELYNPSPEHVIESQTPPSSGGRKKASARKSVVSPKAARRRMIIKLNPKRSSKPKPSTPPKQPTPPPSPPPQTEQQLSPPHLSPPHQSPPHQPSPQSLSQIHIATPPHEQPVVTSQQIFQTPPSTQPQVQTTPGSSGFKDFPHIPVNIPLEDIGDFSFVNDEQVKKLEKKVEEVLVYIDILKARIAELEDEKARRDEQKEYFKLKNKELEATNAKKEHEMFMINKVLENLIGTSVEQKFEEIQVEEVRARRQAAIDAEMKNKGKGVEGVSEITERAIIPSSVSKLPVQNPCPISAVSGIFEEDVLIDDVNDDEEDVEKDDDEEEDVDEDKTDDADDVFSASSHSDDDNDDDGQGGTGIKVTEASTEENVDDYLHDDANEEPENAEGEGENVDDQNVDEYEKLILRIEPDVEEGEIRHTYTLDEYLKLTHVDENNFKFDFEEELNDFDINRQPEYQ